MRPISTGPPSLVRPRRLPDKDCLQITGNTQNNTTSDFQLTKMQGEVAVFSS